MEINVKKIFWGILLLIIGLVWMGKNLGIITFPWHALFNMWPMILIFWGISVLPIKNTLKLGLLVLSVLISLVLLFQMKDTKNYWFFHWDDETESTEVQQLKIKYDTTFQKAQLHFEANAANIVLQDSTTELFDFQSNTKNDRYEMTSKTDSQTTQISVSSKKKRKHWGVGGEKVTFSLNTRPVWDVNFDVGAADLDFDFSPYKTSNISLNAGASSIHLKLGALVPLTKVDIEAGASSVHIEIPKASGCEIHCDHALSSKSFKDFTQSSDNVYKTPNFETASQKIIINMDAGISDIKVVRY